MNIQTTAIIGMGALGMLYGSHIQQQLGKGSVRFVMDSARYEKHKGGRYTVNGEIQDFILTDCTAAKPADLVIVATKYGGLHAALDVMESSVGENTILMSGHKRHHKRAGHRAALRRQKPHLLRGHRHGRHTGRLRLKLRQQGPFADRHFKGRAAACA
jgi:ketopantoate reductase